MPTDPSIPFTSRAAPRRQIWAPQGREKCFTVGSREKMQAVNQLWSWGSNTRSAIRWLLTLSLTVLYSHSLLTEKE